MNVAKSDILSLMMDARKLERILKGCANHRRVEILSLLKCEPELTLEQIAEHLGIDFRVASEHLRRMVSGGLVLKRYEGRYVRHALTDRAKNIHTFIGKLE